MTKPDFSQLDKSGRPAREFQQNALNWLTENWNKYQVFAVVASTSVGKTFLARTIQIATNAAIITSSNVLVNQYKRDYKEVNVFYGMDNYHTQGAYEQAKLSAALPEFHTVYNPASFRIAKRQPQFINPKVVVLDEAHAMISLMQELCAQVFVLDKNERFRMNLNVAENAVKHLTNLLADVNGHLRDLEHSKNKKKKELERKAAKYEDLIEALTHDSQAFALYYEDKQTSKGSRHYLHIKPTKISPVFLNRYFKGAKIVMMSATLLPSDIRELGSNQPYALFEADSPIDPRRRPFYICPTDEVLSHPVPVGEVARKLDEILTEIPLRPAIVHCTYSLMTQISSLLKTPHLCHTKDTKAEVLEQWMNEGGVLLAAGMSEGLDLKDDLCRLNIITKLQYPNLTDEFVQKKMSEPLGRQWYNLECLKHLLQANGRSTRSPTDASITICLDGRITSLLKTMQNEVPKFFKSAIVWQTTSYKQMVDNIKSFMLQ